MIKIIIFAISNSLILANNQTLENSSDVSWSDDTIVKTLSNCRFEMAVVASVNPLYDTDTQQEGGRKRID